MCVDKIKLSTEEMIEWLHKYVDMEIVYKAQETFTGENLVRIRFGDLDAYIGLHETAAPTLKIALLRVIQFVESASKERGRTNDA